MLGFFVAGTDTGVGKTLVSAALLEVLGKEKRVIGTKPVASGCHFSEGIYKNSDALMLMQHSNVACQYDEINSYSFQLAIAPHIAAKLSNIEIDIDKICRQIGLLQKKSDGLIIEGVGGWLTPLSVRYSMADLAICLDYPVILVVGLRLGCINHALLTVASIMASQNITLAGWIGSQPEVTFAYLDENIQTLKNKIESPCLGIVPHIPGIDPLQMRRYFTL